MRFRRFFFALGFFLVVGLIPACGDQPQDSAVEQADAVELRNRLVFAEKVLPTGGTVRCIVQTTGGFSLSCQWPERSQDSTAWQPMAVDLGDNLIFVVAELHTGGTVRCIQLSIGKGDLACDWPER